MKEKKDCKIIQNLLPNYIDNLTDEEINSYIEEHLKECENCNQVLDDMKKELEVNSKKRDKREVKYMKKFKNKIRILKFIIVLILLLILILFGIVTGRKMIIISNLSKKAKEYESSSNYHITTYYYSEDSNGDRWYTMMEVFRLNDKIKTKITEVTDEDITITTAYKNDKILEDGFGMNTYFETKDSKIACFNYTETGTYNSLHNPLLKNQFYTENIWELFRYSIKASIKPTICNGDECYYITNFEKYSPEGIYVDKQIGMPTRGNALTSTYGNGRTERTEIIDIVYEFDMVREEEFIEPDISEYEVKEWFYEQNNR